MNKNISVCGIDCAAVCDECSSMHDELKKDPCKGCNEMKGKIFWTKLMNMDTCPIYTCVKEKDIEHCGECEKLPCEIHLNMRDPNRSVEEHQQGIENRVLLLKSL